jgi:hypothetical protein
MLSILRCGTTSRHFWKWTCKPSKICSAVLLMTVGVWHRCNFSKKGLSIAETCRKLPLVCCFHVGSGDYLCLGWISTLRFCGKWFLHQCWNFGLNSTKVWVKIWRQDQIWSGKIHQILLSRQRIWPKLVPYESPEARPRKAHGQAWRRPRKVVTVIWMMMIPLYIYNIYNIYNIYIYIHYGVIIVIHDHGYPVIHNKFDNILLYYAPIL